MGQSLDSCTSPRVKFDENSNNGVMIANMHIPREILFEIFVYSDCNTLLNCHLVCKRWHQIIKSYVWRKKAENIIGRSLPSIEDVSWRIYYLICCKMPLEKSLIINPSGDDWLTVRRRAEQWDVENPPIGLPPLPTSEPIFKTSQNCFVTSFSRCRNMQVIDLVAESLMPHIIDNLPPAIERRKTEDDGSSQKLQDINKALRGDAEPGSSGWAVRAGVPGPRTKITLKDLIRTQNYDFF